MAGQILKQADTGRHGSVPAGQTGVPVGCSVDRAERGCARTETPRQVLTDSTARHAVRGMARSMAADLGEHGIQTVHAVVDGWVAKPALRERYPDHDRWMDPDEVAVTYRRPVDYPESPRERDRPPPPRRRPLVLSVDARTAGSRLCCLWPAVRTGQTAGAWSVVRSPETRAGSESPVTVDSLKRRHDHHQAWM